MTPATPFPVSQLAEDLIIQQLSDEYIGLIPTMQQLLQAGVANYGSTIPLIDLSEQGGQLWRGQMEAADYWATQNPQDIAMFVYTKRTADQHLIKNNDFSGPIIMGLDVVLTSRQEDLPLEIQRLSNLMNDAIYNVFGIVNARALLPLKFNGGISAERSKPRRGGQGWQQVISFTFPMGLN